MESYIEKILTKEELVLQGVSPLYGDLVVSPVEGDFFSTNENINWGLSATHDSLNEKCQKIFAIMKGPSFKNGFKYSEKVRNIDFLPTLCRTLKIPIMKDSTGKILEEVMIPQGD